ncbi:oligosaccharide flippase family protein [Virgibacillus siamensis]|uniref:oligosaccharide flippase family protein n=1 Tax=Virgibacillus siamensis TaxID=480071 RepID=UPI00158CD1A7|nr:oligosaccharide flippase family protein [Virgibacillus siamensis]
MSKSKLNIKLSSSKFIIKIIESFFGRGSFLFFTVLFSLVCTRLYGAELFGEFTYAFTIVQVSMIVAKAGMDQGLMYSIPQNRYKHVSLSFVINLLLSFILIVLLWFLIDDTFIRFMLPLIWMFSCEHIFFGIYRSEGMIKEYYFINGFLSMILRVGLIISFYYLYGENEYSIALGVYFSFLFSIIMYLIQNRKKFKKLKFDKSFLLYSIPLILATMMDTLINKVDILMLGFMTTTKDVGIYQITVQVSLLVSALLIIFNTVFAPEIAKLYHQGKKMELRRLYIKATRCLAIFSLITTSILLIGSEFILYIFGSEFVQGQTALILRSLGQFVNIAVGGVWLMLAMTGKPRFQMYANIFAFIINILLNLVLIPIYGINGAAFASMITLMFTNIMGYVIVSKQFSVKVFKYF